MVGKKVVTPPVPAEKESSPNEYKRTESAPSGSNIISTYLKEQMERAEQQQKGAESEAVMDQESSIDPGNISSEAEAFAEEELPEGKQE